MSGNNILPVIEILKNNKSIKINIIRFNNLYRYHYSKSFLKNLIILLNHLFLYFKTLFNLLSSNIIITTHKPLLKTKKNTTIELWHGVPLKAIELMNKHHVDVENMNKKIDYFNTTSNFSKTILNSGFSLSMEKYVVLGQPRNDYLFFKNESFKQNFNISNEKILFYLPTFREQCETNYNTFIKNLTFKKFDMQRFNEFLKKNNLVFFIKPHPSDNHIWKKLLKNEVSNVRIVFKEDLEKNNLELYKVLGQSDLLITDYSSVYLDYLLTNKPMIFIPTDLEYYKSFRGLLLEPYNLWTPGPKVYTQQELEREILKSLNDITYYAEERKKLKEIFHKYQDNKSSERVAKFILKKLKNKNSNT
ncbi:MAG: CDP-glycerol glycerophosphotransferase family protein [Candidatus Woesearchaeota archaeon]